MNLIIIYGPPAVGKTTVGAELARITGYRFFFNHLTVPAAKAIFPGPKDRSRDESYWELLRRLRLTAIEAAVHSNLDTIFTVAYQGVIDDEFIADIVGVVESGNGKVCFVQLTAPEEILMERVGNKSRIDLNMGKMTSPVHLKESLTEGMYTSVKYPNVLKLDTSVISARDAAQKIAHYFDLVK